METLLSDTRLQRGLVAASAFVCAGAAVCYFIYSDYKSSTSDKKSGSSSSKGKEGGLKNAESAQRERGTAPKSAAKTNESDGDYTMKGYRTTQDGRKTTYFNRELSETDKSLIGDCAPKPISSSSPSPVPVSVSASPATGQSAWNAAGTWEEKDCTKWSKDQIKSVLKPVFGRSSGDSISVSKVKDVEGEASITVVRGKKKYIYDMSLTLELKVRFNDFVSFV
jgi:hypothetical protein